MSRAAFALLLLHTPACVLVIDDDGTRETVAFDDLDAFVGLTNHTALDLEVRTGAPQAVSATCSPDVLEHLRVEVRDGRLELDLPALRWVPRDCLVTVGVGALETLTADGVGDTQVFGALSGLETLVHSGTGRMEVEAVEADALRVLVDGTGGLWVADLVADTLRLTHDGTGPVEIVGTVEELSVVASGTGGTDLGALVAARVEVDGSGNGPVVVHGTERVSGTLTGTGDLRVRGGGEVDIVDDGLGQVISE